MLSSWQPRSSWQCQSNASLEPPLALSTLFGTYGTLVRTCAAWESSYRFKIKIKLFGDESSMNNFVDASHDVSILLGVSSTLLSFGL